MFCEIDPIPYNWTKFSHKNPCCVIPLMHLAALILIKLDAKNEKWNLKDLLTLSSSVWVSSSSARMSAIVRPAHLSIQLYNWRWKFVNTLLSAYRLIKAMKDMGCNKGFNISKINKYYYKLKIKICTITNHYVWQVRFVTKNSFPVTHAGFLQSKNNSFF